jgi:hypothetical protein
VRTKKTMMFILIQGEPLDFLTHICGMGNMINYKTDIEKLTILLYRWEALSF